MSTVVVAGAGVIGLMCAYELRRRGFEVVVVDRAEPGRGCSWANMGWVVPSFARPLPAPGLIRTSLKWMLDRSSPLYIAPRAMPGLAGWLWRFWRHCNPRDYRAGLEALARLAAPTLAVLDRMRADGVEYEMHAAGVLFLFLSRRARDEVQRDLELVAAATGGGPRPVDRDQLRAMESRLRPEITAGIFMAQERHVRPESLVAGLLRRLRELGVEVRSGMNVIGVRIRGARHSVVSGQSAARGTGVSMAAASPPSVLAPRRSGGAEAVALVTPVGEVSGDLFLLAGGVWTAGMGRALGVPLPIQGGKGYTITIERPAWQPAHALYLDEARVAWSPLEGALRIGGTMEFSGLNTELSRPRLEAIRAASQRYMSEWPAGEGEAAWAGLRPLTPDGLPVLGRLPGYDNVFVAAGHGMLGITLAPSTASVTADLLARGAADVDLTPFRADRWLRWR